MVVRLITMLLTYTILRFPVNSPTETSGAYESLTVTNLKALLTEKGITFKNNASKSELVALLEGAG